MYGYFGCLSSYVLVWNVFLFMSEVLVCYVLFLMSEVLVCYVFLFMSGVGSSYVNWDDDLDSVVLDDSISCVGSKSSC